MTIVVVASASSKIFCHTVYAMNPYEQAWNTSRARISELMRATPLERLDQIAPLTPEWRVRDILAHLVGVSQDISAGNFPKNFDEWTSAQVDRLRDTDAYQLVELWADYSLGTSISEPMAIALYDQVTHEADIFHALGVPARIDDETLELLMRFTLNRFDATNNDLAVALHLDGETWRIGEGSQPLSLVASRFEWFRASSGRRSANQIRLMLWQGDVDVIELLFGSRFFVPAQSDVEEFTK